MSHKPLPDGSLLGPGLVVRTDAIGDLIQVTPALTLLKRQTPHAVIDALVAPANVILLEENRTLRNVLANPGRLVQRVRLLRAGNYQWAVVMRPEPWIAIALWLAGIPVRIGTARRWYSLFFNRRISQRRKHGGRHEAQYNAELLQPLGIDTSSTPWVSLSVREEQREASHALLRERGLGLGQDYVVIHPGSRGSAPNLPWSTYSRIASELIAKGVVVVVTGVKGEAAPLFQQVSSEFEKREADSARGLLISLEGMTTLSGLIGVLAGARLVVASSTGPLHLAAAVGTPVIAPYGLRPAVSAPRWKPWVDGQNVNLIEPEEASCPARCKGRCGREGCLATLSVDGFLDAIQKRLPGLL